MTTTPWTLLGLAAAAVWTTAPATPVMPAPPMRAGIVAALDSSAAGWTAFDLDRFMAIYLDSDRTTYATKTSYLHGVPAIRAHYASSFAPGAPRSALRLEKIEVDSLGPAVANVLAFYVLTAHDSTVGHGPTSLLMQRVGGRWLIVHDHSG
jgi:ketosteroid isomerase-like protein